MTTTRSGGAVERLARLETQMEGVKTALDRGSVGFEKIRQTMGKSRSIGSHTSAPICPRLCG